MNAEARTIIACEQKNVRNVSTIANRQRPITVIFFQYQQLSLQGSNLDSTKSFPFNDNNNNSNDNNINDNNNSDNNDDGDNNDDSDNNDDNDNNDNYNYSLYDDNNNNNDDGNNDNDDGGNDDDDNSDDNNDELLLRHFLTLEKSSWGRRILFARLRTLSPAPAPAPAPPPP